MYIKSFFAILISSLFLSVNALACTNTCTLECQEVGNSQKKCQKFCCNKSSEEQAKETATPKVD